MKEYKYFWLALEFDIVFVMVAGGIGVVSYGIFALESPARPWSTWPRLSSDLHGHGCFSMWAGSS